MAPSAPSARPGPDEHGPHADTAAAATAAWSLLCDLVLDNVRRREVAEALGMSFGRARLLRRVAHGPMTMGELAAAAEMDKPYATVVVDDFEAQGLVRRRPHPTDGRARVVAATRKGQELARRADRILGTPPAALSALDSGELETLVRVLDDVVARERDDAGRATRPAGAPARPH